MNLRNGKITAVLKVKVPVKKEEENPLAAQMAAHKEKMKVFADELEAMFFEAKKYEDDPYGRLCVYRELFEIVDSNINECMRFSCSAQMCMAIRDSTLRMVAELGVMAFKHGNDEKFLEPIVGLSDVLLSVLTKLGSA